MREINGATVDRDYSNIVLTEAKSDDFKTGGSDFDALFEKYDKLDAKSKDFIRTQNLTGKSVEDISNHTKKLGSSFDFASVKAMAFNMALSAIAGVGIGILIQGAISIFDNLITTQDELKQAAADATQEYENTKSTIEDVNSELETNKKRVEDLKAKGTLTYVEQTELDKLELTNTRLEKQLELLDKTQAVQAKDAALATAKEIEGQYSPGGNMYDYYDIDKDYINRNSNQTFTSDLSDKSGWSIVEDNMESHDIGQLLADYKDLNNLLDTCTSSTDEYNNVSSALAKSQELLTLKTSDLSAKLADMGDVYSQIEEKQKNKISLTTDESDILQTYDQTKYLVELITEITDPGSYNTLKFDEIFDTEGVEKTKEELIEMARAAGSLENLDFSGMENLVDAINDTEFSLEDGQSKIGAFKGELFGLVDTVDQIDLSLDIADGMDDSIDSFDRMADQLATLADLQDALGSSFQLSAEEARAFAEVYPEILAMGTVSANGLIQLNSDQVTDFISGKETEIRADGDSRIAKLEAAKTELEAKKAETQAKLDLALAVANGEVDLTNQKNEAVSKGEQALTEYLLKLGYTESEANAAVAEAMAGNMEEYGRITGDQAGTISYNLANSLATAATSSSANAQAMIDNIYNIGKQAEASANSIKAMENGTAVTPNKYKAASGGRATTAFETLKSTSSFKKITATEMPAVNDYMAPAIEAYKLDLSKYNEAIANIDSQIALLKAGSSTPLNDYSSGKYTPKKSSGSGSNKKNEEKAFSKTIDWITVAIEKLEDRISKLGKTASNVYKNWITRNQALSSEVTNLVDKLDLQQRTYSAYMDKANSIGLSEHYKNLVQNGSISIETITDEALAGRIEEYQKWYDAALAQLDGIQDTELALSDAMKQKFDNISSEYDNLLSDIQFKTDLLDKSMNIAEAKGLLTSESYYKTLIGIENENRAMLEREKQALSSALNEAVKNETIVEYSEGWYEMVNSIRDVESALSDADLSLAEFGKSLKEVQWEIFDYLQDSISQITTESDFLIDLLSNKKLFDKNGQNTDGADSILALRGVNYNTYMEQSNQYADAIKKLDDQYKDDELNKDYLARRQELTGLQQEMISNAEKEKQSMIDLVRDGYEAQLEALEKLINLRRELLDSEKELYDYQKEIASKTKDISEIKKQISSYNGDDSEESKKSIQQLKVELQNAEDSLEETEYEKYLADQEAFLSDLYDDFEQWINERMDNTDAILNSIIDNVNNNSGAIGETIKNTANDVGYTLSESMKTIFGANLGQGSNISNILTTYDQNFSNRMTTLQSAIDIIKVGISQMAAKANAEAQKAKEEAERKQQEAAKPPPAPAPTPPSTGNGGSGNGGGGGSGSNSSSIFVYKKDSYPKGKLQRYLENLVSL